MSTAFNELVSQVGTTITADSGAGGLSNTASTAYVRNYFRAGDSNYRNVNWPVVVLSLVYEEEHDAFGVDIVRMLVQFDVVTKLDWRFVEQDAVVARMRDVFHHFIQGAAVSQWKFNEMAFRSTGQPTISEPDNEARYMIRARVDGRKVA